MCPLIDIQLCSQNRSQRCRILFTEPIFALHFIVIVLFAIPIFKEHF